MRRLHAVIAVSLVFVVSTLCNCDPGYQTTTCKALRGADFEPMETRCDGIDNDCDGLVDVLLPTGPNSCQPRIGAACVTGHAACVDESRVCLAPGPAPEVRDGKDNDCNGVIDDVPPTSDAPIRARALLLVPRYLFSDSLLEIDQIASVLDQWGISYDRPTAPEDFDASLDGLAKYPLVIIPGYLEEDFLTRFRQQALESYAAQGGILVIFKPSFADKSVTQQLTGTTRTERSTNVEAIAFDGRRDSALRVFDSHEELLVPLNDLHQTARIAVHILTPSDSRTQVLATAKIHGAAAGAVLTRRLVGDGAVYALGHDMHSSLVQRCYVNCFEPSGDLAGLFLREAFREGLHGHVILKHTVPGPEDSLMILSHDVDALDAQQASPAWGDPGALQVARAEADAGARGSFFITTQYITTEVSISYFSPDLLRQLCALGMCPVGAHSVVHSLDFSHLPLGTCNETSSSYDPFTAQSLCGEVRVSLSLIENATGVRPIAWRSPFLAVNASQYDVLSTQGFLLDSSYAIGDIRSNLPVSLAHTGMNQFRFHHQPLYTMPIVLEDGIGSIDGSTRRTEMSAANTAQFLTLWSYALLRNADNGAHTLALLHPSYGFGQPYDNLHNKIAVLLSVLSVAKARGLRTQDTAAELVKFWRAREEVAVDGSYVNGSPPSYQGTIRTGDYEIENLTLEFGDMISKFDSSASSSVSCNKKRVTLLGRIAPNSLISFIATISKAVPASLTIDTSPQTCNGP